jgi:hypothetical protein
VTPLQIGILAVVCLANGFALGKVWAYRKVRRELGAELEETKRLLANQRKLSRYLEDEVQIEILERWIRK